MAMNNNAEGRRVQADNGRMFESFIGGDANFVAICSGS
jgi:hypothetical protein